MTRAILTLLLIFFATPAAAAVYSGETPLNSAIIVPVPAGPGKYLLTVQLDKPVQLLEATISWNVHVETYYYADNSLIDQWDVQYDRYMSSNGQPTRIGSFTWEIEAAGIVADGIFRHHVSNQGLMATLNFSDEGATTLNYRVGIAAVPEPGEWALLIAGFALGGAALRRRRPAVTRQAWRAA